jgi:hypothetical protein
VLGELIEDRILSVNEDNLKKCWTASFERHADVLYFDDQESAFFGLVEFLNCCEKYFYDSETGNVFRMIDVNEIALQGFRIKVLK